MILRRAQNNSSMKNFLSNAKIHIIQRPRILPPKKAKVSRSAVVNCLQSMKNLFLKLNNSQDTRGDTFPHRGGGREQMGFEATKNNFAKFQLASIVQG